MCCLRSSVLWGLRMARLSWFIICLWLLGDITGASHPHYEAHLWQRRSYYNTRSLTPSTTVDSSICIFSHLCALGVVRLFFPTGAAVGDTVCISICILLLLLFSLPVLPYTSPYDTTFNVTTEITQIEMNTWTDKRYKRSMQRFKMCFTSQCI